MYSVDVYLRVRRAVMVEGMSVREASRVFGLHRDTVRKMLAYSVPPGYRRKIPPRRPKLEAYTGVIDRILEDDLGRPKRQRHTAKRAFERLRDEYGFDGGYTIVKDYVREHRRMVGATGRKDRSTGWPDGLEGQVVAVKLILSTRARSELSFFPAPPTTSVKVYTRQWRARAVANILGMNRNLMLVRTMAIPAGPAATGLVTAVGHLSSALSGGDCSTE